MKRGAFLVVLFLTVVSGGSVAKTTDCFAGTAYTPAGGSTEHLLLSSKDPSDQVVQSSAAAITLPPTTIPVYFHLISDGLWPFAPEQVLEQQMVVLNDSFSGDTGGAPTPFSFSLAGITRTTNAAWYAMGAGTPAEQEAKTALRVGDEGTLNIYVVNTANGASWGSFPWRYSADPWRDGVVLDKDVLWGGIAPGRNLGDVAVHEAGHWFGLYHTFEDFNTTGDFGCEGEGDYVDDTPAEKAPASVCPVGSDTCPTQGADPIHNFMDYTADPCVYEFTPGQVNRMQEKFADYRIPQGGPKGR